MSEISHKRARLLIEQRNLSPDERGTLAAHLGQCEECRRYAEVHVYLTRNLQLAAVRTRPAPALRAAVLSHVESQHRRNQIMSPIKALAAVAVLAAVLVIAWQTVGTAARQSAAAPPVEEAPPVATEATEAPTQAPSRTPRPTLTPLPTRSQAIVRQVITAEELAGVWGYERWPGVQRFWLFRPDGTYSVAATLSRERLEETPSVTGEFWFEGNRFNIIELEDTLDQTCIDRDMVGIYDVQLLESGALRIELVEDGCAWRSADLLTYDLEPAELTE